MKVKELKKILQQSNENAEVYLSDGDKDYIIACNTKDDKGNVYIYTGTCFGEKHNCGIVQN